MYSIKLINFLKKFVFVVTIFFACGQFVEICATPAKKSKKRKGGKRAPKKKGKKKAKKGKGKGKKGKGKKGVAPVLQPSAAPVAPTRIVSAPREEEIVKQRAIEAERVEKEKAEKRRVVEADVRKGDVRSRVELRRVQVQEIQKISSKEKRLQLEKEWKTKIDTESDERSNKETVREKEENLKKFSLTKEEWEIIEINRLKREIQNKIIGLEENISFWLLKGWVDLDELQGGLLSEDIKIFLQQYGGDKKGTIEKCFGLVLKKYNELISSITGEIKKIVPSAAGFVEGEVKNLLMQVNKELTTVLSDKWNTEIENQFSNKQEKDVAKEFIPIALCIVIADINIKNLFIDESSVKKLNEYLDLINTQRNSLVGLVSNITDTSAPRGETPIREDMVREYKNQFIWGILINKIIVPVEKVAEKKNQAMNQQFWGTIALICRTTANRCIEFVENKQAESLGKIDAVRKNLGLSNNTKIVFNRFGQLLLSIGSFDQVKRNLAGVSLKEEDENKIFNSGDFKMIKESIKNKFNALTNELIKALGLKEILIDPFINEFLPFASVFYNQRQKIYFQKEFEAKLPEPIQVTPKNLIITNDSDVDKVAKEVEGILLWDNRENILTDQPDPKKRIVLPYNVVILLPPLRSVSKDEEGKDKIDTYIGPAIAAYKP